MTSTSQTDYTLSNVTNTTVTISDGTGESGNGKETYHGSNTKVQYAAKNYRDRKSSNVTEYNSDVYAGYQLVIASGYKLTASKINVDLSVSQNFTYRVVVLGNYDNILYASDDFTITNYNSNSATNITKELSLNNLVLVGTIKVRLYYWYTGNSGSKYIVPITFTMDGALETASVDTNSPEITTDLDDENAYTAYLGVEKTLSIEADHVTGYQWYTCTNAAGEGASAIDGATNYVYAFTPSVVGTYYYKCVATNTNATGEQNATSKVATVNVEAQTPVFSLTKSSVVVGGTSQIIVGSKAGLDGLTLTDLAYDDEVISISASGAITALAKGTTTITFTTAASGNYAAGSANLSITVTGKVVASSTPSSWTGATSRTWSVSSIALSKTNDEEDGDKGLYFKAGTSNSIDYSSGTYFSLKPGNTMYLEVPSATSTGIVKVVSTQNDDSRYLQVVNAAGTQNLTMSKTGNTLRFDANSIEEIDGKYYIKLAHGAGECKIAISNFATVTLDATKTITAAGWATLYTSYPLDFSEVEGLTAYIVTGTVGETTELDLTEVTSVPANTGVLLEGTAGDYTIPVAASSSTNVTANKLEGVLVNTVKDANSIYVLMNETAGVGFYKNNKSFTVGANTAYLPADFAGGGSGARSAYFFGSDITGVANVEAAAEAVQKDGKFFKNGKLVIFKNGKKYNANGQLVK